MTHICIIERLVKELTESEECDSTISMKWLGHEIEAPLDVNGEHLIPQLKSLAGLFQQN
jgi:hypothetical protein